MARIGVDLTAQQHAEFSARVSDQVYALAGPNAPRAASRLIPGQCWLVALAMARGASDVTERELAKLATIQRIAGKECLA